MGKGKYITALLHPLIPSLKKTTTTHLSSLCSTLAAPTRGWWQSLLDGRVVESLVSSRMHMSVWVSCACFLGGWYHWRLALMHEHGVTRGSVQSQEWLSVFILSLLMFQGPSFYHRLRSNSKGRKEKDMITNNSWWQQLGELGGHSNFTFLLLIKTLKVTPVDSLLTGTISQHHLKQGCLSSGQWRVCVHLSGIYRPPWVLVNWVCSM